VMNLHDDFCRFRIFLQENTAEKHEPQQRFSLGQGPAKRSSLQRRLSSLTARSVRTKNAEGGGRMSNLDLLGDDFLDVGAWKLVCEGISAAGRARPPESSVTEAC
jgi:hypothetical protein